MIEIDRREIYRYLGYRATPDDVVMEQKINRCLADLQSIADPRSVSRRATLSFAAGDTLIVDGISMVSHSLTRNLTGCCGVFLFGATLGVGVDRAIAKISAKRMSDAVVYQAAAAAMIEAYCDEVNETLRQQALAQGFYLRPRYSPGYGDLDIRYQKDFIRLLDAPRRIGLTVTESCLLAPIKSVTAVIGLADSPQPCHRQGCEACNKTDCAFRR